MSVPKNLTSIEERSVVEAALSSGARRVVLMHESVLSAIGAGIDIAAAKGRMVVNIGAGRTDIAVICLNDVVVSESWKTGGLRMDKDIESYIHAKYHISVGALMAEKIKIELGNAVLTDGEEKSFTVKGYNNITELPDVAEISEGEVNSSIKGTIFSIIEVIQRTLEVTPPELAADIMDTGITLCGGVALLKNIDKAIEKYIGVPCKVAENPERCVVLGAGKALKVIDKFSSNSYDISEANFPLSNLIDL